MLVIQHITCSMSRMRRVFQKLEGRRERWMRNTNTGTGVLECQTRFRLLWHLKTLHFLLYLESAGIKDEQSCTASLKWVIVPGESNFTSKLIENGLRYIRTSS